MLQTRSLTNSRMASATFGEAAMAATHDGEGRAGALGAVPHGEEALDDAGARAGAAAVVGHDPRVEGQRHGRHEEVALPSK